MKIDSHLQPDSPTPSSDELLRQWVDQVRSVRQRMVLQALLKILALALVAAPLYVTLFAWIDHHLHLGPIMRLLALGGLIAACIPLLYQGLHLFRTHISLSCAANAVEAKHCLDQQLVAAIEYYEQQNDYPYSRGLVEQMIRGLDDQVRDTHFKDTIPTWPTWLCSGVVFISLMAIAYMGINHLHYYSRYLTRLTHPTAAVAPLPATELTNQTGPLLVGPQESFQMRATLTGRQPERGQIVIESDPNGNTGLTQTLPAQVTRDSNDQPELAATWSLSQKGQYRYRFTAGDAHSDWQPITVTEFPAVTTITARVTFGQGESRQTLEQEIPNDTLSVYKQSEVELTVQTSQPLMAASASLPQLGQVAGTIDPNAGFHLTFTAQEAGPIVFDLINEEGHPNREDHRIEVLLKKDQPPRIELLSPDGDYVATNGASIPIRFAVTDDMALESAAITLELNDGQTRSIPLEVPPNSRTAEGIYELELEEYDLDISDSLIFYAQAKDTSSLNPYLHLETVTEPYFIEIRPYRQWVHQDKSSMPSVSKQGLETQAAHDSLMAVLEYTRAFLKKTWSLAQQHDFDEQDKTHLTAISSDIDYASEQLSLIRDDPRSKFSEEQVVQINGVRQHFTNASKFVCTYHPVHALDPEKQGYFELRNLIKELDKALCPPGQGTPPQQRDRYKIEEQLHVKRYDKERLEWELEQINQKLAELARAQDKLEQEFLNFLEQQEQNKPEEQKAHGRDTWQQAQANPTSPQAALPPETAGHAPNSKINTEGAQAWIEPDPNKPPSPGGGARPQPAQASELMRMMQAQEKALQEQLDQLSQELESLPQQAQNAGQQAGQGSGVRANPQRQEAKSQLQQASKRMEEFDQALSQQYYRPEPEPEALSHAHNLLKQTEDHLAAARAALAEEVDDEDTLAALQAEALAQQLEELARQYDPSVSPEDQQTMQELLKEATALLKQMPENWWQQNAQNRPATPAAQPQQQGPMQLGNPENSGGGSGLIAKKGGLADNTKQLMQQLAQSFWSVSMAVQKETSPLVQPQMSHPQYSEQEDLFFELSAAQAQEQR